MEVATFTELEAEFLERAHRMVWCSFATVDRKGRPRSRILHPIWEGMTGWIATVPTSHKAKHMLNNPYVSLAYVADVARPVYVDCRAEWVDDLGQKQRIWDLFKAAPPPLGYDPGPIFGAVDGPRFGLLKLTPWRVEVYNPPPAGSLIWRPGPEVGA